MFRLGKHPKASVRAALAALTLAPIGLIAGLSGTAGAAQTSHASLLPAKECAANRAAGTINWASSFGYSGAATILEVFAAQGLGYFKDMCLSVNFITNSYTSQNLVSTDAAQITGEGSAADYLLAVANGSNLRSIATDGDESNYALLTQPSITNLSQLAGKTLGYHQTVPVVISEMLAKAKVRDKVDFVDDNSYDPTLLTQGKFDALQAYRSNEPYTLKGMGLKFNEFIPSQYGVSGTFGLTVVNASFLKKHTSAVRDFMRADLEAFYYCIDHAVKCIDIEQSAATSAGLTYDYEHEYQRWKKESNIAINSQLKGHGIGVETTAEWASEDKALVTYGLVKKPVSLSEYENTSITASLYNGTKLIWP